MFFRLQRLGPATSLGSHVRCCHTRGTGVTIGSVVGPPLVSRAKPVIAAYIIIRWANCLSLAACLGRTYHRYFQGEPGFGVIIPSPGLFSSVGGSDSKFCCFPIGRFDDEVRSSMGCTWMSALASLVQIAAIPTRLCLVRAGFMLYWECDVALIMELL